jgi:hypothetical protein
MVVTCKAWPSEFDVEDELKALGADEAALSRS